MLKQKPASYLFFFSSLLLYIIIGYGIERHQTLLLFTFYFIIFFLYIRILREQDVSFWIFAAIIFRAALLFSVPALSDDFYRFIWDGRLLAAGYHPFAEVPAFYMTHPHSIPGIEAALYNNLNSKETFTIYPPLSQFIFWLSVKLSNGSVYGSMFVMKVILFGFEIGTLRILTTIIRHFKHSPNSILVYALNPLVILELTGNLHFEGVMIFFLLLGIFFLTRRQHVYSSVAYALSICTKLIPLLFLPLFAGYLGWKKAISYWVMTTAVSAILFLSWPDAEIIHGFSTSLGYYFQRFEFNASIYYLIRGAGYLLFGFNIIQFSGPVLALIATVSILIISFRNLREKIQAGIDSNFFMTMIWCLLVYFLFTTTLHPWYIITLVAICVLTPWRFPVAWSGLIFLTYAGYTENSFHENLFLVALEYIFVIAYLLYETVWMKRRGHS